MVLLILIESLTLGCVGLGCDRSRWMNWSSKPWGFSHPHYTYPGGFISGYILSAPRFQTSWLNTRGLQLSQGKLSHEGLFVLHTGHSLSCSLKCHTSLAGRQECDLSVHIHVSAVSAHVTPCWIWTAFVARCSERRGERLNPEDISAHPEEQARDGREK